MDTNQTTQQILTFALQLPPEERVAIADALLVSVPLDEDAAQGLVESSTAEVEAVWSGEIERRIDDIQKGRVKTIPAEEAERAIRGKQQPGIC